MRSVTAVAHPNIALVKYWGKRNRPLNLPAAGSISVTLDQLATTTRITIDSSRSNDQFTINGKSDERAERRVLEIVELLRARSQVAESLRIESTNNFPTAAGLASSASGFAALVTALDRILDLKLGDAERSEFARRGSGSAARSIFGGFVEMDEGSAADGSDAVARPIAAGDALPLSIVIAVTSTAAKTHGSGPGMEQSRRTSPFYPAWVESTRRDLDVARRAISDGDFDTLAEISIHSCMKMHATMLATRPPLYYWSPATLAVVHALEAMRQGGDSVFYTIDAGPQVKAFCPPDQAQKLADRIATVDGVIEVHRVGIGGPARVSEDHS